MIGIILSTLCAVVLLVGLVSMAVVSSYFVIKSIETWKRIDCIRKERNQRKKI